MGFKEYKRFSKKSDTFSSPEKLLEEIKNKNYKPIMVFFGEEKMRMENAVDYIKKTLLGDKTNDFNYEVIYCEDGSGVKIYQSFITPPFLGGNKLLIVREAEKLREDDYSDLIKALKYDVFKGTVLIMIFYDEGLPSRGKNILEFLKELTKRKAIYKFNPLTDIDLNKKVQGYLKQYNMSLDTDGFGYLVQELGNQQDVIFNVLSQLVMYEPEKKRITLLDIKKFIINFRGFTVYDFTNAIANKRIDEALRILDISGNSRENLIQLVAPIMRMLEQLYKTKSMIERRMGSKAIAEELGIPLKVVETEFIPQARNFDKEKLLRSMEFMSRFDLMLRTLSLPPEIIISNLLFDLCL
ncbi:MAG: DNA polymerase III subunit delta [Myxococcota bacterium]